MLVSAMAPIGFAEPDPARAGVLKGYCRRGLFAMFARSPRVCEMTLSPGARPGDHEAFAERQPQLIIVALAKAGISSSSVHDENSAFAGMTNEEDSPKVSLAAQPPAES